MSTYSAGLDSGGSYVQSLISRREPSFLQGGRQIDEFVFYFWETDVGDGGGLKLFNSNGNAECGFATNNPQWDVWNGYVTEIYAGDGYERWVRVEMVFDWSNGQVTFNVEDQSTGSTASRTISLINGKDVSYIELLNYDRGFGSEADYFSLWIDAIQAFDGDEGYYDDFEDGTLQGWTDPTGNFNVTTNPSGVDVDKSRFDESVTLSKDTFSLQDKKASTEHPLELDLTGETFSFIPTERFRVRDEDGIAIDDFSAIIVGEQREGELGIKEVSPYNPPWMSVTLSRTDKKDGTVESEFKFHFDRSQIADEIRVLQLYCKLPDGKGNTSAVYYNYHIEKDIALRNIMGQEDKFREDAIGGGNARAVVTAREVSAIKVHWGPYEEGFGKADLQREVPFTREVGRKHEIIWAGLSVNEHYGFYLGTLTPHGQTVESGIYEFTTGDEVSVWSRNFQVSLFEAWEKGLTVEAPFKAFFNDIKTSHRSELEDATVDSMNVSLHEAWEKEIQDRVQVNNFDSNISTSHSYEIN